MNNINCSREKIWIAGHTGMVGQALCRKLQNHSIVLETRSKLNLHDDTAVLRWVEKHQPTVIFLAAAKVGGIHANSQYPVNFLLDNLKIQNNVLQAAKHIQAKKTIFLGSACTYPKYASQPIKEQSLFDGKPEETNIWYATAKLAGIKLAQALRKQYALDIIVTMPTNAYGPSDNFNEKENHVIPALIKRFHQAKIHQDKTLTIWGSGKPLREFIFVDDLAEALIFLAENYSDDDIINVGSGNEISILDLAKMIAKQVGFKGEILTDTSKPDGTPRKLLDSSKLHQLGWQANTKLPAGIKVTYDWAIKNTII